MDSESNYAKTVADPNYSNRGNHGVAGTTGSRRNHAQNHPVGSFIVI